MKQRKAMHCLYDELDQNLYKIGGLLRDLHSILSYVVLSISCISGDAMNFILNH
jgi:hypothetical protein